jgi:ATP-binding cassette, subfamily F, member 3
MVTGTDLFRVDVGAIAYCVFRIPSLSWGRSPDRATRDFWYNSMAMALLSVSNLAKYYGADAVFTGLTCELHRQECVALIGPNGCGKSTLLEIMAGDLEPDEGAVHQARRTRLGYLPQHPDFQSDKTLWEAMESVFSALLDQAAELRRLEAQMASSDEATRAEAMARYGTLLHAFEDAGGFTYEARISQVLGGLGFAEAEFHKPIAHLSGGEKTRALLARLLLEKPDLLLLDEPTNHLDIEGIEWLEEQLKTWDGAIIVVAHDRAFLDAIADRVWELDFGTLETYPGNYSAYTELREERRARRLAEYEAQQAYIEKTEGYIRRYMAGQRSAEAKGRLKRLERLERLERPKEHVELNIDLQTTQRSGELVLGLYDVAAGYPDDGIPLIHVDEAEIRRGQRVALVGPNGSGKTTLLRTILRDIEPLMGRVRRGGAVHIGYFAQIQAHLDESKTILKTILDAGMVSVHETRSFLARYGFRGETVFKKIGVLSGGERARVALAILALQKANFLLLDEPTNHLDLPSQELFQEILINFAGTILMVSHDRYLIRETATHVWALDAGLLHPFKSYEAYEAWHQARREQSPAAKQAQSHRRQREDEERRKERERQRALAHQQERLDTLEATIAQLEERLKALTTALKVAGEQQDVNRVTELGAEYRKVENEMNNLLEEWAAVAETPGL